MPSAKAPPELSTAAMTSPRSSTTVFSEQPVLKMDDIAQNGASEKSPHGATDDSIDSIYYEYLTFETPLPCFVRFEPESSNRPPPEPLNLKSYDSPFTWSRPRKNLVLFICCGVTLLAAYSAGAYSIAAGPLREKWHLSNVAFNTGVTTWAVGFAISPMFLAPLSEINGRRPVFIGSGILFVIALVGCAITDSFAGMLIARFFVGAGASTFATMVGGVISDIYHADVRNSPMAIYSGSALAGTGLGPMVSGFIVERVSWRWVFYAQVIALGATMVVVILFFKETRGSVLLSRRASQINKYIELQEQAGYRPQIKYSILKDSQTSLPQVPTWETRRIRYKVVSDESRSSLSHMLYASLTTPFKLLSTEPVVFFFSLWVAFAWAVLYMTFDAIPLVFETHHNFSVSQVGAVFSAIAIGSILGTLLSVSQEKLARQYAWGKMLTGTPERRLYFACLESALLPIGLFWFGWTSGPSTPWIVPVLALACAQIGIFTIYLAVFNYLADVYHRFASSALAGQSFCRNILAAVFPLITDIMFRRLGYPGAASLLGGVSALLTVVPWVLLFYGPAIRARSKIASEIMHTGRMSG